METVDQVGYLLDTNVVSELRKAKKADRGVRMWARRFPLRAFIYVRSQYWNWR